MNLRKLASHEAGLHRDLRLRAVCDAPDSFGETFADAAARSMSYWEELTRSVTAPGVQTAPRPVRSPRPPIWIGGGSDAALRRAVRYGDAWHPIRLRLAWLRERLAQMRKIADGEHQPMPALAPRIKLRLTDARMPDDARLAGEGTLDQIRKDLIDLQSLGATYVTLDTYLDDSEATRDNGPAWRLLEIIAERALDLAHETVR